MAVRRDGNQSGSKRKKRPTRSVRPQTKTPTSGVEQPKRKVYKPTPVVHRTDEQREKQRKYDNTVGRQPTPVVRRTDRDRAKARRYHERKAAAKKQRAIKALRYGKGVKTSGSDLELKNVVTPAIEVLDQSTRVAEFVTGSADYQINRIKHGRLPTPRGAVKAGIESGVTRKDRKHGSDVLKSVGVKNKAVQQAGGLAIDIATDPLTYATLGAGGGVKAAAQGAAKAGAKAETKALAKGATRKQAKKAKSKASRKAYAQAPKGKGVSIGVGSKRTSGKTSARALSVVKPASKTKPARKAAEVRDRSSDVIPTRPRDIPEEEWNRLKAVDREHRGAIMHGTRRVARRARAIRKEAGTRKGKLGKKRLTEDTSKRIRDAIEANDLSPLSAAERRAAQTLQREQEKLLKMRRDAGEKAARYQPRSAAEPKGYVYRQVAKELEDPKAKKVTGATPARKTTTLKDFQRHDRRPMATVRETSPGKYVEDIETTLRVKGQKDVGRAANTVYRGKVLEMGRKLKPSTKWDPETEGVFTVRDGRLVDVSKETFSTSEVVVLKRSVADHANAAMESVGKVPFLDAATSKIKWVLTIPNPQYWARNAYGGTYMAWQSGVRGDSILRNAGKAARINRRITKSFHAEEKIGKKLKAAKPVQVLPNGGKMDMDEFVSELERVNISGGGQTNELLGAEFRRRGKAQGAEDFPRLVSYIHWRRAGHTPEESARKTLQSQIDYGDLSRTARAWARRIFPFWAFRSRNVIHQGRTLVTRPGKFATTEKIRDTLASSAGLGDDWQDALSEGEQAGVPIPTPFQISVPGLGKQTLLLYPGLPVTDMNLFTLKPGALGQQIMTSVNPLAKAPIEFWTNYNFFWRDKIEGTGQRWVAAPDSLIDNLPKPARQELIDSGVIRQGKDRWTGKMTWQWRGRSDYLAKLTPLTSTALQTATSGRSRKGQTSELRTLGWLTGIRPQPFNPTMTAYGTLLEQRAKVQQKIDDLIELRVHKRKGWDPQKNSGEEGWDTPEYTRLKERLKKMDQAKYELEGELDKKDRVTPPGVSKTQAKPSGGSWVDELAGGAPSKPKSSGSWVDEYAK